MADLLLLSKADVLHARARLFDISQAFVKPLSLKAAILLQIPDIIATAGPDASLSLTQIIEQLPSHAVRSDYLYRILRFLVAIEVFDEIIEEKETRYRLTPVSKLLVKNTPICFSPMVLMQTDEALLAPLHHLHEVVLEGGLAFTKAHGKNIWELEKENESLNFVLNNALASNSKLWMLQIFQRYDGFQSIRSLVDVGGGLGESISQVVAAYPHIHAINYDLPHVIAIAPLIPGVEHVAGNMFESVPSADAIFIKAVLHDWDDDQCTKILKNCHKVLPHDGKLIIVDTVLNSASDENREIFGLTMDLLMIALATGGKERSENELQNLLNGAGFTIKRIVQLELGSGSLIEACKSY